LFGSPVFLDYLVFVCKRGEENGANTNRRRKVEYKIRKMEKTGGVLLF
jgi:hypothetical protein